MNEMLLQQLKNFGFAQYQNEIQRNAVEAIYKGGKNIYVSMPKGKSVCYQLPISAKNESLAIVISPEISYAKRQVEYLKNKNITAYFWYGKTPKIVKNIIKGDLTSQKPKLKFLFVTAEQCETSHFLFLLTEIKPKILSYIIIIKAEYFGSIQYKKLRTLRKACPIQPFVVLTTSMEKKVQKNILSALKLKDPLIFSKSILNPILLNPCLDARKDEKIQKDKQMNAEKLLKKINRLLHEEILSPEDQLKKIHAILYNDKS